MTPTASDSVTVLFVCLGNICRSPTAEGIFRAQVQEAGLSHQILVDSAGSHAYHEGESPDIRACAAALERGFDLSGQVGRQIRISDFEYFDYILAMDCENLDYLLKMKPANSSSRVALFLDYADGREGQSVPDPYFGHSDGFALVIDLIELAGKGLLEHIGRNRFKKQM
jgi:protein-tyrosine phosphatase